MKLGSTTAPSVICIWTMVCCAALAPAHAQFAGGDGSIDNPYLVATAEHLENVRDHLSAHFRQIGDIDLGVAPWNQGGGWNPIGSFNGQFDGAGFVIYNLTIDRAATFSVGLFDSVGTAGSITNVCLENADVCGSAIVGIVSGENSGIIAACRTMGSVSGNDSVGGLIGINWGQGTSTHCQSTASVTGTDDSVSIGGLIGQNDGAITACHAGGIVSGWRQIGGLVGANIGSASECYASGVVTGAEYSIGGLVGINFETAAVVRCYATGSVCGQDVGGLIGVNHGTVMESYAIGAVEGDRFSGGLVEWNPDGTVTASFWDLQATGQTSSDGGEGRTTAEMTFPYATNTYAGWAFGGPWVADAEERNSGYPYLSWQTFDDMTIVETARGVPTVWYCDHDMGPPAGQSWTQQQWDALDEENADGDGMKNWEEFVADTNPTNAQSVLRFRRLEFTVDGVRVEWQGGVEARQVLERSSDLTNPGAWQPVLTNEPPTTVEDEHIDAPAGTAPHFYRINVERP